MATNDVPGANPKNMDKLNIGCWAEDKDNTSLILIVGLEADQVVFDMYDVTNKMFYRDTMLEKDFKSIFSVPPVGKSDVKWVWHDKTAFPWDRVMARFTRPVPQHADVLDQLTAAERVARKLNLRGRELAEEEVTPRVEQRQERGRGIIKRLADALNAFAE